MKWRCYIMANKKRKEIQEFKIEESTRTVKVYNKNLTDKAKNDIRFCEEMGYKVVLLEREKPKVRISQRIGKNEMRKYLKDNIDTKIYNQLVKKLDSREMFCDIRHWLKEELQKKAKKDNKDYVPANTIIQVAMKNEEITAKINAKNYKNDNIIKEPSNNEEEKEEE